MKKLGFWLMIALLIINIAAITTIIIHIRDDKKQESDVQTGMSSALESELGFSKEQIDEYAEVNRRFRDATGEITENMKEARMEMIREMNQANPDTLILTEYARQIGNLHFRLKQHTINHLLSVRAMCTPEQQVKLETMFTNILKCEGPFKGQGQGNRWRHRWGQKQNQN